MPTPPYAKLRIAVNAGAPQTGAIVVSPSDVLQFSAESTAGWSTAPQWQIYAYPAGWSTPSGWASDGHGNIVSTSITPPAITLPAPGGIWGKWLCRLIVNNSSIDELTGAGSPVAQLVDSATAFEILSANGLHDLANFEDTQFGTDWVTQHQTNLRTIDTKLSTGGGGVSYLAHGTITQYKAVASYTATQRQQATPTLLVNGAELVGVASATVLDGATVQYAKVGETITVSGLSGGVAGVVTLDATGGLVKGDWGGFIIGKVDASDRLSINPRAPSTRGNWFTYGAIPDSAGQASNNVTAWNAMMSAISPSNDLHGTTIKTGQRMYVNAPLEVRRPVWLKGMAGPGGYDNTGASPGGGAIIWTVPTHGLFLAAPGWVSDALANAGLCRIENLELFGTAPSTIKLWQPDVQFTNGDYVRVPPIYKQWGLTTAFNGISGDPGFLFLVTTTGYTNDTAIDASMATTPIPFSTITESMSGTQTGAGKTGAVYKVVSHAAILGVTIARIDHCSMQGFAGCGIHLFGNGAGSPVSVVDESRVSNNFITGCGGGIRITSSDANACLVTGNSVIGCGIGPGFAGAGYIDGSPGGCTWVGNYTDSCTGSGYIAYAGAGLFLGNGSENVQADIYTGFAVVRPNGQPRYYAEASVVIDTPNYAQNKFATDNRVSGFPTLKAYLDGQDGTFFGLNNAFDNNVFIRTKFNYSADAGSLGDWFTRGYGTGPIPWSEAWSSSHAKAGPGHRWEIPGKFVGAISNGGTARRWWGWDGTTLTGANAKAVRRGERKLGDVWWSNEFAAAGDFLGKITTGSGYRGVSYASLGTPAADATWPARVDGDVVEDPGTGLAFKVTEAVGAKHATTPTWTNATTTSAKVPRAWTASTPMQQTDPAASTTTVGDFIRQTTGPVYPASAYAWQPKIGATSADPGHAWTAGTAYKANSIIRSTSNAWFFLYAERFLDGNVFRPGAVVRPTEIYNTLASTTSGANSAAAGIDHGTRFSQNAIITATLTVTAKTGTSLTVTIDTSPDNSTWTPLSSFTAVTVAKAQQSITATLPNRPGAGHQWVRVSWLSDGFTFNVVSVVQHEKRGTLYMVVGGNGGAYTTDLPLAVGTEPDWSIPTATDALSAYWDQSSVRIRHVVFKTGTIAEPKWVMGVPASPAVVGDVVQNQSTLEGGAGPAASSGGYFYGVATTTKTLIQGTPGGGGQWVQFWPTTSTAEPAWSTSGADTPEVATAVSPDRVGFGLTWENAGAEALTSRVADLNGNQYTRFAALSSEDRVFRVESATTAITPQALSQWGGGQTDGVTDPNADCKVWGERVGNGSCFVTDNTTVTSVGAGYAPPNNTAGRIDFVLIFTQYSAANNTGHALDGTAVLHCHVAYQNIATVISIGTPKTDTVNAEDLVGTALAAITATNATIAIVSGKLTARVTGLAGTTIKVVAVRQNPELT